MQNINEKYSFNPGSQFLYNMVTFISDLSLANSALKYIGKCDKGDTAFSWIFKQILYCNALDNFVRVRTLNKVLDRSMEM